MANKLLKMKQKLLIVLLEKGQLQNSQIAKHVGITEQWCSELIAQLHAKGLIESEFKAPRRINRLSRKGVEVAKLLKEVGQKIRG